MRLDLCASSLQAFDESELLECIRRLVEVEQAWVPDFSVSDLYVRPTFIGTEVEGKLAASCKVLTKMVLYWDKLKKINFLPIICSDGSPPWV